jgi:hypothetical protein
MTYSLPSLRTQPVAMTPAMTPAMDPAWTRWS